MRLGDTEALTGEIEEFLTGEEVSFMVITDGKKSLPLAAAKDYKKAFDGETGKVELDI